MTTPKNRRATDKSAEQKESDLTQSLNEWKVFSKAKFDEGAARMTRIEVGLKANTELTEAQTKKLGETQDSVKEVLEVVTALKGGKTILGWAGKVFVWCGSIALAWSAISAALHGEVKLPWQ